MYNHWYNLYTRGWDVFTCKNVLCTCSYVFHSHGCNKFLHARICFTLADTTSIIMFVMYLHARMFRTLAPYVFYSHGCNVRAWNLFWASVAKPVLWQLMILLHCTLTHMYSIPMGAINFYMQEHFLDSLIVMQKKTFFCSMFFLLKKKIFFFYWYVYLKKFIIKFT